MTSTQKIGVIIGIALTFPLAGFVWAQSESGGEGGGSSASWVRLTSGVGNDLNSIACPDERTCYIMGGAPFIGGNGIILKTMNGGDGWVSQSIPLADPLRGISCLNAELCYAAGDGGVLLKTVNGGSSWTRLAANTAAGEQYYWDIAAADANHVTAVGNAGIIYRTTNGGVTWRAITSGTTENLHNVYFANSAIGWVVGTAGKVLKTINGGLFWSSLGTPSGVNSLFSISSS
ncbi:MAG: YCF48-related protein, partial [Patescibacteria group bacterium]